ncbi:MAG TPA: hypothetical protein PKW37_10465 [Salinivirgaceae bacterium]|nr:hypothetical protein [Salinivirgaceae bacterium]
MRKVLIITPQSDQALAVARYIKKYDKNCVLHGGLMPYESSHDLYHYDKIVKITDKNIFRYYDIVLPTGAISTHWMATQVGSFKVNGVKYSDKNLNYFKKIDLLASIEHMGVPIPKTYATVEAVEGPYPIFYKQKFEKGGGTRGVAYVRSDLEKLTDCNDLIFQEYIPGRTTYGVGFIIQNGEMIVTFQHQELLSYPLQGGSAVYLRRFYDERLEKYTRCIVQGMGYDGWGLAEFKYCNKRKDFVFMEVNAKLWASIEFAFINNNKFLKYLLGINYQEKKVEAALFIDRLIALGWKHILLNIHHLSNANIISYRRPSENLRALVSGSIPLSVKSGLKALLSKTPEKK